jgi:hypothetical protein
MSPTSTLRDLIDDTPRVLGDLTRVLDLHEPLWEEHRTSKLTGVPKYGDPGQYISTGNIVRDRSDDSDIELTDEDLAPAMQACKATSRVFGMLRVLIRDGPRAHAGRTRIGQTDFARSSQPMRIAIARGS